MKTLKVDAGFTSIAGIKPINEDRAGVKIPQDEFVLSNKGVALSLADGVSSAEAGKEASHTAVDRFLQEYFQTPDTWSVAHCGEKILSTINLRLYRKSQEFSAQGKGFLSTFSSVIIKGQTAHFFHVGDSRVYLYRDGELLQQSSDHITRISEKHSYLSRAIGMDNQLHLDYGKITLQEDDMILISSDGVHDFLTEQHICKTLSSKTSCQDISEQLVDQALLNESDDNISAVVARIEQLPKQSLYDHAARLTRLPFPPELEPGMKIDGFEVIKEVFASSRSQLYLVKDLHTGEQYAMKTPSHNYLEDLAYIDRFIQEEWIGSRIDHPNVVKVIRQNSTRNFLYYLMEYVEGIGLDQWIEKNSPASPRRSIHILKQIALGLEQFHNNETLHQDLKPANILVRNCPEKFEEGQTLTEQAVILDFGSVHVAGLAEIYRHSDSDNEALGTAAYSDPIYLSGRNPGIQGDIYALATISYEMFCQQLPYGDKINNCRSHHDYDQLRFINADKHNPVIPAWFNGALKKGCDFDLQLRYQTIADFMKDITQPNPEFLKEDPVISKNSNSLLFWKLISGFWFLTFVLVIYLFSQN